VPEKNPAFADIYGVAAALIADKHDAPRRSAVVQARDDYVTVFARTTQVSDYNPRHCLLSDVEPSCRLDKPGMYTTRHKHSIARTHFGDRNKCDFYGTLGTASSEKLLDYWETQLGLR